MQIRWEDKRHVEDNIGRITGCKSKRVEWTIAEQFWLPRLDVKGILELVMMLPTQTLEAIIDNWIMSFQDGFFAEQKQPESAGRRDLRYDVEDGTFILTTESYAKVHCAMDFGMYPYDIQTCNFVITTAKDISQQVQKYMGA